MSEDRPHDPTQPTPGGADPWSSPGPSSEPSDGSGQPLPYGQGSAPPPPPQSPYAQPAYAQPPYGQQPYGQQPYAEQSVGQPYPGSAPAYGGGYGPSPLAAQTRSSATLWLILNIVTVLFCSNLPGIVGAIYAGLALGKAETDTADAQRKIRLSKIWFFAGLVLAAIVIIGAIIALAAFGNLSDAGFNAPSVSGV